jgi:hypothetical protein
LADSRDDFGEYFVAMSQGSRTASATNGSGSVHAKTDSTRVESNDLK